MRISAITRSISVVAVCLLLCSNAALAARFIDTNGAWSEKYINQLSDQGVINAESDGKFLPNEPVTRAVFAYWLVKVLGLDSQPVSNKPSFPDVKPSDWCYKPIEIIRQNNYVGGFADGFRPNQLIQKAEFIQIIARTLNTPSPNTTAMNTALANWSDKNKIPLWAKPAVAQATMAGVILTKTPHLLEPTVIISRGDAAAILSQLNAFITHQTVQDSAAQAEATFAGPAPTYPPPQNGAPYNAIPPGQYRTGQPGGPSPGYYPQPQYPGQPMPMPYGQAPYYPLQTGYAQPTNYLPTAGYGQQPPYVPPQTAAPQPPAPQAPAQQAPAQQAPAPQASGRSAVVNAGTEFHALLKYNLDSLTTKVGEPVEAKLASPFSSGGVVLLPAGSTVAGTVTGVVSARQVQFVHDGKIYVKFTSVQTPDGRKLPLEASFDSSNMPRPAAPAGTAAGAANPKKGLETRLKAGTSVPVKLNQNMQVAAAVPAGQPPGYGQGGAPPPRGQPPGYSQPINPPQYGAYPSPPLGVYPSAPAGYPAAPGGYPSAPAGYPSTPGYPAQQQPYYPPINR